MNSIVNAALASPAIHNRHEWIRVADDSLPFLNSVRSLLNGALEIFAPTSALPISRQGLDGTWFLRGTCNGQPLALVWSDFRVNGASTSKRVADTYIAFLNALEQDSRPLLIVVRSMGVRFMEGRTVFPHAFSVLPTLNRYRKNHLVMTLAHGNALGLGALIFGMGHYRMAVSTDSCLNLTGPEVCKMVFGRQVQFEQIASNDIQFRNTHMIHELCDTLDQAFFRLPTLLALFCHPRHSLPHDASCGDNHPAQRYVSGFCDHSIEVFIDYDDRLKAFIGVIGGKAFGILINPPENPNNMLRTRSLHLLSDALDLFEHLQLPVVSLVDTPGADPRMDGNNRQIIEKLIATTQKIIEYPHRKMGIVIGRAYGGASVIGFPKFFGGCAVFALENAHVGVMHESIIIQLLSGSARLTEMWQTVSTSQTADLQDMIEMGAIDNLIGAHQIREKIERHLLTDAEPIAFEVNRRLNNAGDRRRPMTRLLPPHGAPDSLPN